MSIDATILTLTSDIDLASGEVTNFLSLMIPTGQVLRAVISEDSAACLRQLVQPSASPASDQVVPVAAYPAAPTESRVLAASLASVDEDGTGQI